MISILFYQNATSFLTTYIYIYIYFFEGLTILRKFPSRIYFELLQLLRWYLDVLKFFIFKYNLFVYIYLYFILADIMY